MVVNNFRPDATLKRAEDLINVGQAEAALQTLYDFITSKRTRAIQPSELEPIAILFVKLSVELKNSKLVKDGLHQYKKNVQTAATGLLSLETVVTEFISMAELRLNKAQAEVDHTAATAAEDDEDDLELELSPETILLSAVSTEDSKDRSERDLITPSLRFLWESYRTVLDLLRNNSKLELSYHKTVLQLFLFLARFNRKSEFHRLCDILRQHVQSATNYQKQDEYKLVNYIDLSDADTLQRFLELRFLQLSYSVKLELWQESFRSIEDVHTLLETSKRLPRPQMMLSYYENLAKVFAVSENHLFHAAALQKYFNLYSQLPTVTAEDVKSSASIFLLSLLAIPQFSGEDAASQDFNRSKSYKFASLLNLPNVPTRESIIDTIVSRGILKIVDPELQVLFKLLEEDFHPITFSEQVQPLFRAIETNEHFRNYIKPLTNIVLIRLFQQLAEVYETIRLDFLIQLCTFQGAFALTRNEIENILVETAQKGSISVKIDHASQVVSFRSDPFDEQGVHSNVLQPTPSELVHNFLANLAKTLNRASETIYPSIGQNRDQLIERSVQVANKEFEHERAEIVERLVILEERDRALEELKRIKKEEEEKLRLEKLALDRKLEAERKELEARNRLEEKIEREKQAIKDNEKKKLAEEINAKGIIKVDVDKLEDLDADKLRLMQIEQLNKEKRDLEEKLKSLARRLDHTERAYRKSELPLLAEEAKKQEARDVEIYEQSKAKIVETSKREHEAALQVRDRLHRVVGDFEQFKSTALAKKQELYKLKVEELKSKLELAKQERIEAVRAERRLVLVAELKAKKAEEQRRKEEELRLQEEELRIAKVNEERRKRDELAAKQRELEQAAIRKQAELRGGRSPAVPLATGSSPSPVPSGKPMTFREKMLLKRQQQEQR